MRTRKRGSAFSEEINTHLQLINRLVLMYKTGLNCPEEKNNCDGIPNCVNPFSLTFLCSFCSQCTLPPETDNVSTCILCLMKWCYFWIVFDASSKFLGRLQFATNIKGLKCFWITKGNDYNTWHDMNSCELKVYIPSTPHYVPVVLLVAVELCTAMESVQ